MLFRRKSALLVDFDNMTSARLAEDVAAWVGWLERGGFETDRKRPRRRTFVTKRVYWYGAHDKVREPFEEAGFDAYPCRSQVAGKNPTDMMVALDAVDLPTDFGGLKEVILLSRDSDFIPVVTRLKEKGLDVVVAADREDLSSVIYRDLADRLIYVDDLKAQIKSRPPPPPRPKPEAQAAKPAPKRPPPGDTRSQRLDEAARALADAAEHHPGPLSRKTTIAILKRTVRGFSINGRDAWLGCGDYRSMLEQIAARTPRLRLRIYPNTGVSLQYNSE
jgi:uncharacterized LabA/DUF88 family protein